MLFCTFAKALLVYANRGVRSKTTISFCTPCPHTFIFIALLLSMFHTVANYLKKYHSLIQCNELLDKHSNDFKDYLQ